jgi:hypothetical protein
VKNSEAERVELNVQSPFGSQPRAWPTLKEGFDQADDLFAINFGIDGERNSNPILIESSR